jgi:hypothetical protein
MTAAESKAEPLNAPAAKARCASTKSSSITFRSLRLLTNAKSGASTAAWASPDARSDATASKSSSSLLAGNLNGVFEREAELGRPRD